MADGYVEFEFDLPDALLGQLLSVLGKMNGALLSANQVQTVPDVQGIYQLFLKDKLVYIGKTDAEAGLKQRLTRHSRTITHRKNLNAADVKFKAARILVFTTMDLETQLIGHHGGTKAVPWNNSGFGANDPGRQRDMTALKEKGFDTQFPIDIDQPLELELPAQPTAFEAIRSASRVAPYTVRVEGDPELKEKIVELPIRPLTMRTLLSKIISRLSPGWQATKLPGRIIMYRENEDNYPGSEVIKRSE